MYLLAPLIILMIDNDHLLDAILEELNCIGKHCFFIVQLDNLVNHLPSDLSPFTSAQMKLLYFWIISVDQLVVVDLQKCHQK